MNKKPDNKRKAKKSNMSQLVKREVAKAINKNIETKFIDVTFQGSVSYGTYNIFRITTTSQGTGDLAQRIGDRIKLKYLDAKFNFTCADTTNRIRLSIIRYQDDDGTSSVTAQGVYQDYLQLQSYFNFDSINGGKFKVLYDKIIDLELNTNASQKMLRVRKPLNHLLGYTGASSGRGHIYVLLQSDSGATTHPQAEMYSRITYKDA